VDSSGLSGGMLTAWNPRKDEFSAFLTPAGILLDGFVKDLDRRMKLINCYGPYWTKRLFGRPLKGMGY
jgi:hypothetical protein